MDCENHGGLTVCGNFAELLPEKPKDFNYKHTAKWLEPYPFEKREVIGSTICSCKVVECHYAPYYGSDYYHVKTCNLMRKVRKNTSLMQLWAYNHLPYITFSKKSVPASSPIKLWIETHSRTYRLRVRCRNVNGLQAALL